MNVLVVLSGGQDSTTCLYLVKHVLRPENIDALTFDYGQRHSRELKAASVISQKAGVRHHNILRLGSLLKSTSPLVSDAKLEQYKDFHSLPGGIEKTFVPLRNMLFLTIAVNHAIAQDCRYVVTGVSQEDSGGYPDCRQKFILSLESALLDATEGAVAQTPLVVTPLVWLTKAETVKLALSLPGCYESLAFSHTAYDGAYPPTGHDHATLLREKGFEEAGVPDPLVVRAVVEGLMPLPNTNLYNSLRTEAQAAGAPDLFTHCVARYDGSIAYDRLPFLLRNGF